MNNEIIIKNQYQLIQVNSNKNINDNELDKNIDVSTTKEEESFITEELIQYCSSPKRGLVSINNSCISNDNCIPMPTEKKNQKYYNNEDILCKKRYKYYRFRFNKKM